MESGGDTRSGGGEISPQLLDLIPGWAVKGGGGGGGRNFGGSEERKLELKLGPPGEEDWFINGNNYKNMVKSPLYLGGSSSSKTLVNSTKRGFQDTIDEEDTETRDNETWGKNKCSTSSSQHHHHHQQQQQNSSFLRFPPQNHSTAPKDSSQNNDNNKVLSTPAASSGPANATITNTPSQKRTAPAPVVGWPPVRSFRRNLTSSASKPAAPTSGSPNEAVPSKEIKVKPAESVVKKGLFVKINMDGVPIGRKVDLNAYDSYEKLSSAVDQLFRDLLAAQIDSSADLNCPHVNEAKVITGLLDGSGEYTLVYEDNEGDRMLVGDVPWGMFATTVKRLRVLKTSELSTLHVGNNSKQGKPPVETKVK
ncbi:hypothetical protein MKW98_029409 [Papaver atlanticum]|uniref:Auxin-responsive protein n=1 Tax=Papaver atlanticum TaxID=357466 RepID=A0AAD4SHU4_9MAGN|nr:hypothetical protein MKW98_029409 [Papaver atlanticum]